MLVLDNRSLPGNGQAGLSRSGLPVGPIWQGRELKLGPLLTLCLPEGAKPHAGDGEQLVSLPLVQDPNGVSRYASPQSY